MKCITRFALSLVCLCLCASSCYSKKPADKNKGVAVVELFTSEGCSSCPAAEATLAQLQQQYGSDVLVLEFHVDYWNYLGWKDEYSSSDYTRRQQQYAGHFNLSSTYTPQAIVNGKSQMVGSDKSALQGSIERQLQTIPATTITLAAKKNGGKVVIDYTLTGAKPAKINIALVQKEALTDVKRGENSGRKLHHTNVVRAFATMAATGGKATLELPEGVSASDYLVIAYAQQQDEAIIAATQSAISQ